MSINCFKVGALTEKCSCVTRGFTQLLLALHLQCGDNLFYEVRRGMKEHKHRVTLLCILSFWCSLNGRSTMLENRPLCSLLSIILANQAVLKCHFLIKPTMCSVCPKIRLLSWCLLPNNSHSSMAQPSSLSLLHIVNRRSAAVVLWFPPDPGTTDSTLVNKTVREKGPFFNCLKWFISYLGFITVTRTGSIKLHLRGKVHR